MTATETVACVRSTAEIATAQARRYMIQLCKHFEHKLPVTYDDHTGRIALSVGVCRLAAAGDRLTLSGEAPDAAQLAQLQDVVARHLVRFAFREEMQIDWRAA